MSLADALRLHFDRSFAASPAPAPAQADFLAFQVGRVAYAVHLNEVASVHRDRPIVRLIQSAPHRLGVAGFRSAMAPVFDLRSLLGSPGHATPRWVLLTASSPPIALAFDSFEGHLRVDQAQVSLTSSAPARPYIRGAVQEADIVRLVVHLESVIEAIRPKEHSP